MQKRRPKFCIISSVPITLWAFYRGLLERLNKDYADVTLVTSNQLELEWLKKELRVATFTVELPRCIAPFQDLVSLFKLWRFLYCKKFDVVHTHTPKGSFIGMIASLLAGVPNRVYTIHGSLLASSHGFKHYLLWIIEWLTCRLATNVLVVSPSLLKHIAEKKLCSLKKMCVLGDGSACGVNLNYFNRDNNFDFLRKQKRKEYNIPFDAVVIGFVGRIVPDKGIKALVQAFENLQKVIPECYLFLVGEFEEIRDTLDSQTLQKIKTNLHIRCNREWVSDVKPFYATLDIVTLPTKHEGFGLTLIEAAAFGLPTIASEVTGCIDAVVDNVTGLFVEVDNVEQLVNAMMLLVKDTHLRIKLGENGRKRVQKRFDSELLIVKHVEYYGKLKNISFRA